ncbi:intermembrane phospholipid transport protein YdbH family protein [Erythrobacter tepidarius]|uniref:intermembrane phospholipid transport protein YdbH family protein n=1 Tax=Erythrobacter tepidarius TaxID=60454 RepID=UPI000A3A253C|nr:YdbH domain-containing protein [Erythrobacter tepidarius]
MAVPDTHDKTLPPATRARLWPRRWRSRIGLGSAVIALAAGSFAWLDRERIAGDFLDNYLRENGIAATYDIVAIGPETQVIENLVVGNPARPDLTARRMVVELGVGWQGPELRRVRIEGARLYGTYLGGTFSLGALDPLVFTDSKEPPRLPAIDVALVDARALIESDYGALGVKLEGGGRLDDGFAGTLAIAAPGFGVDGCRAERATLYGKLATAKGAPRFDGPLRLGAIRCGGATLARVDVGTKIAFARDFTAAEGDFALRGAGLGLALLTGERLVGNGQLKWSGTGLAIAHDLALSEVAAPQGRLARLEAKGSWRGDNTAARGQWQGDLAAQGVAADLILGQKLAAIEEGLGGTLLAPLLARLRGGLTRGLAGAGFRAEAILRHKPGELAVIVPEARLSTRSGARVLALSQVNAGFAGGALVALRGNLLMGGAGLPAINGRIEQGPDGGWSMRMAMAEYAAGANRLAIPRLSLRQTRGGGLRFDGLVSASGDLPGGGVRGLDLPLEGGWSPARGLTLGTGCMPIRFRSLALSGLELSGQQVTLCPDRGTPLLAYRDGLRLAANIGPLELSGRLGDSPARISAGEVQLRYPAPFAIGDMALRLGEPGSELRLTAAKLSGRLRGEARGDFAGATARLDAVPLDLDAIDGRWAYASGVLRIDGAQFRLSDRPVGHAPAGEARFTPLAARDAVLTLSQSAIRAAARLHHPESDRLVAEVTLTHDLDTARGGARLAVPGLVFDRRLQPADLSILASGVIALASGTVTGEGRIDWQGDAITSSGTFASDGFDFAAAFGPVRGLRGKVEFTDLVNLTTAPDQTLAVAAINPGIEVLSGKVRFALENGTLLRLEDARFPFMGGELVMRPLAMNLSQPEERRYVFEISGLDAATFVAQMELTNLAATGTFDGTVPIVFDKEGNGRIEGGVLLSRAGGGNVAYIGELSYEDLGTMGNYAFSALRSLDYRQMSVGLNGSLGGEIITNFDFDGVRQGAGARQNFITRRLAKLPIRFKVNVRSENFYELATMVRSFWDVDFLGNPVDRGLLKVENGRFVPANPAKPVQPPESKVQP